MATSDRSTEGHAPAGAAALIDALIGRRSRRFGAGMRLNGGPLAHTSEQAPRPLTPDEQAALAFAGCGVTGYALGDLPYQGDAPESGGGNIMIHFLGRTVPSGDAAHATALFVTDDEGTWMLRRPQDFAPADIPALLRAVDERRLLDVYERSRVRIADGRAVVAREVPLVAPFNKWSANQPGSTVFLPVSDLTALALNIVLAAFSEEYGYFVLDERQRFQPAGLAKFARSRGGHLYDDPAHGRVSTIGMGESWLYEFAAIEQGAMIQNLGLMAQALGLGGFAWFAAHPFAWPAALGFRMARLPLSHLRAPAVRQRAVPHRAGLPGAPSR